jgi:hypothetical protein
VQLAKLNPHCCGGPQHGKQASHLACSGPRRAATPSAAPLDVDITSGHEEMPQ